MRERPASERQLIDVLARELGRGVRRGVLLDIGDDAAVLAPTRGRTVLSVDASVEGVHFRRAWAGLDVLGARAFEAALSDLAAMGSRPVAALLALAMPAATTESEVRRLASGVARAAHRAGCPVVGGNLTRASEWSITTTVVGEATRPLTRAGARPGDGVFVTGPLGGAALGLALLDATKPLPGSRPFVRRFLAPRARIEAGLALHGVARACIDVSDGLLRDVGHVAAASGVTIELEAALVPRPRGHDALAARLGLDGISLALAGGEDYELVFTAPAASRIPTRAHRIGRVVRGPSEVRLIGHGPIAPGFDHFHG